MPTTSDSKNTNTDDAYLTAQGASLPIKPLDEATSNSPEQSNPNGSPTIITSTGKTRSRLSNSDVALLNQTLKSVLDILSRYDTINIKQLASFLLIQNNVSKNEYTHPDEFKNDIDLLFREARLEAKVHQQNDIERLYQSVTASIKLETSRAHTCLMDTSTLDPNYQEGIRTALFRPTLDGFIFTDANANIGQLHEQLPSKVQAIAIHPTPSENFAVPTLKQSVQQPYRFPSRYTKHEDKPVVPVQWLDYGPFTSFAPVCDSNNANTSYEWTYMGRAAKRHRRWERKQRRTILQSRTKLTQHKQPQQEDTDMDVDMDVDWLKQQGLDVDAILGSVAVEEHPKSDNPAVLLEKNGKLIENLLSHQESRFTLASTLSSSDAQAIKVNEQEEETANKLQHQFREILSQLPPSAIIHSQDIETAMARLPLKEATYRGTLPSNKIFAYPTSERIDSSPPPFANITPTYSKDRWRMIDLQGHDTLSASPTITTPTPPSASPSTSQQPHTSHVSSPLRS